VYADRQEFRELFTTTLPLLRAGRDHTKFLLSPLVRYLGKSCCSDMSHIINSTERNYGTVAGQALKDYGTWLQDLAFTRRIHNFAVLNPNSLLREDDPSADNAQLVRELWRDGPVHMAKDSYELLCNKLLDKMGGAKLSRQTEKKLVSKPVTFDMAKTRKHWVADNDSAVHRRYDYDPQERGGIGGGRGRGRWPRGRGYVRGGRGQSFVQPKPY
jgi:hypothetical protein